MKTSNITSNSPIIKPIKTMVHQAASPVKEALKELMQKFSRIPEIGKFKPIKVPVQIPGLKQETKVSMLIESSVLPNDYRTRILTISINSNTQNSELLQEMSIASGNKFSIESVLRNPKTVKIFENFIKSSGI